MRLEHPNFVIIGAQKAASTALLNSLRQHPEIWMPAEEDAFLRDPVFSKEKIGEFQVKYSGHKEKIIGLKCPDYLARSEVPNRLAPLLPNPKLLLIVRNPVERAISAYFWRVRWGVLPIVNPSTGLHDLMDGKYAGIDPTSAEVLEWGLYFRHICNYLRYFAADDMLILNDRDLRADPAKSLSETLAFLGATQSELPLPVSDSSNAGVYAPQRLRFLQLRNRYILKWNSERTYYTIFRPRNPAQRAYSNMIAATDRWLLSRVYGNAKPDLSPEVLERLNDYYRADSRSFQELLGREMVGWPK